MAQTVVTQFGDLVELGVGFQLPTGTPIFPVPGGQPWFFVGQGCPTPMGVCSRTVMHDERDAGMMFRVSSSNITDAWEGEGSVVVPGRGLLLRDPDPSEAIALSGPPMGDRTMPEGEFTLFVRTSWETSDRAVVGSNAERFWSIFGQPYPDLEALSSAWDAVVGEG